MFKKIILKLKGLAPVKFKTTLKKFKKFNGYDGLDKKMLSYINFKNGFYIECGANDGVNQSNTWYLEKYLGWKGLLIEPVEEVFRELIKNRGKKNYFFKRALRSFKYKPKFDELRLNVKDTLSTRSTIDNVKSRIRIKVRCENLDTILKKVKAPSLIDFFSLDVEGDEFQVLKGINYKNYKFKFILVETYELHKIKIFLKKRGYRYAKKMSNRNDHLFALNKKNY